ncbi:MAG: YhjD/YihY/BrkB family envelope integrity protein [Phycisphaerales bacterium]
MPSFSIIPDFIRRMLTTPIEELTRWQYALRFFMEMCRHGARQLREDRAGQMAAALSFQTLFGLVPMTIIVVLVFRTISGVRRLQEFIEQLMTAVGLDQVRVPADEGEEQSLAQWLQAIVTQVDEKISGPSVGIIGGLFLVWAGIGLLTTIERCFNTITDAPQSRSIQRRVPLYFTTITAGPLLVYLSFFLSAKVNLGEWNGVVQTVGTSMGSFGAAWLFLFGIYMIVPNTRVNAASAAFGALVATILWTIEKKLFGLYIDVSFERGRAFSILYGVLGLVPVFMIWIYLMWLIILFGLEIGRIMQIVGNRLDGDIPERPHLPSVVDPVVIIPIMRVIGESFESGASLDLTSIAERACVNERVAESLVAELVKAGLVHRVSADAGPRYALARPPQQITTASMLETALRLAGIDCEPAERTPGWVWADRLRNAQIEVAGQRTLAELLDSHHSDGTA